MYLLVIYMFLPMTQVGPDRPGGHTHLNDPIVLVQTPPNIHTALSNRHSSTSLTKKKSFFELLKIIKKFLYNVYYSYRHVKV